jgi:hypothetical protein
MGTRGFEHHLHPEAGNPSAQNMMCISKEVRGLPATQDIRELYVTQPVFLSDLKLLLLLSGSVSLFLYLSVFVK